MYAWSKTHEHWPRKLDLGPGPCNKALDIHLLFQSSELQGLKQLHTKGVGLILQVCIVMALYSKKDKCIYHMIRRELVTKYLMVRYVNGES